MINIEFSLKNNKLVGIVDAKGDEMGSSTPSSMERPVSRTTFKFSHLADKNNPF